MKLRHSLKTAFKGLKTHKRRSSLTILGIVIGVMAIIMVMAIGKGAQELILGQIRAIGSRTIIIEAGQEPKGPTAFYQIFIDSLKDREVEALRKPSNVRGNNKVAPMIVLRNSVAFENETIQADIGGVSRTWMEILDAYPAEGMMFGDEDLRRLSNVAVIGSKVKEELFGESNALGKKIKIKDRTFEVVGVMPPLGYLLMTNLDEMVAIPHTTAQKYLLGINYYHAIVFEAEAEDIVPDAVEEIKMTLRELHGITDPKKDDFYLYSMQDAADRVGIVTIVLNILLISIATISLVVGGIGIMNIMLVSIGERTKEIGLRKAVGATKTDILIQFLLEAIMLTIAGGAIGVFLGAGLSWLTATILTRFVDIEWVFIFPIKAVLLGLGVAAAVGLIFGLHPAIQAAKKSPIETLRYE